MSKQDLIKVVQRSINDAAFRRQLTTDTTGALRGYSLTPDEIGALRSRDAGRLTAFGVDTRMSKVFTIDQGAMGNATITGDSGAMHTVQTPDASERNAAIIGDPQLATTGGVQSPDAVDRNLAFTSGGSEPRDSEPVWVGDLGETATGAVQSPDAMDRNALLSGGGVEPRDTDPTWIGDTAAPTNYSAPIDGSPESFTHADDGDTPSGSEGAIHQE